MKRLTLNDNVLAENQDIDLLLELNESLESLEAKDPKVAELVKLRLFIGITWDEAAKMMDISPRTADSWWAYAKAFLAARMTQSDSNSAT